MKIIKYNEFILEDIHDTPESYINIALTKIKKKIDNMFFKKVSNSTHISPEELKSKGSNNMSLSDLGLTLDSSEISKYSKLYDSLTIKFSDNKNAYALTIIIDIKEGIPKDNNTNFNVDDIKNCYFKFKKYDIETFDILGQIDKNIKIKDITEDFLINIKIEIDDLFDDEEEFEIET